MPKRLLYVKKRYKKNQGCGSGSEWIQSGKKKCMMKKTQKNCMEIVKMEMNSKFFFIKLLKNSIQNGGQSQQNLHKVFVVVVAKIKVTQQFCKG